MFIIFAENELEMVDTALRDEFITNIQDEEIPNGEVTAGKFIFIEFFWR